MRVRLRTLAPERCANMGHDGHSAPELRADGRVSAANMSTLSALVNSTAPDAGERASIVIADGQTAPTPACEAMQHSKDLTWPPDDKIDGETDITAYEDYELPKRQLRPQCRPKRPFQTTWIDTDETGNYDPAQEERQARSKRPRAKAARLRQVDLSDTAGSSDETLQKNLGHSTADEQVSRPSTVLIFNSEDGKSRYKEFIARLEAERDADERGYRLRKRQTAPVHRSGATVGGYEAAELPDDLTGYPVARGCYECAALLSSDPSKPGTEHCSLLDDERNWPCDHCYDDGHDCTVISQPIRKRACEACKSRREACSYVTTRNHGQPCRQCAQLGHPCVAGPVKEYIRPRLRYEREWEDDPYPQPKRRHGKTREPETCEECRVAGKLCLYKPDIDGHYRKACEACLTGSMPCTITGHRTSKASPDHSSLDWNDAEQSHPPAMALTATSQQGRAAETIDETPGHQTLVRAILTSFAHPICFNCDAESTAESCRSTDEQDCHFCAEPALAVYGFGKVEALVRDFKDQPGYEEVTNGHVANGIASTRLCAMCTTIRMSVLMCEKHDMRPILGVDASEAQDVSIDILLDKGSMDLHQFCAVCTNRATFECAVVDEGNAGADAGCGLKLCEGCAITLEREHKRSLAGLLEGLDVELANNKTIELRADRELLRDDGPLMRYLSWMSMQ